MFNFIKKLFNGKKTADVPVKKAPESSGANKKEVEPEVKTQIAPPKKRKVITEVKLSAVAEAKQQESVSGKFCIKIAHDGTYMFNLKASNGEIIATSQTYTSKSSCINGIESVKNNAPEAAVEDQTLEKHETCKHPKFEIFEDVGGAFRFRLKAKNGNIIVASQGYSSKSSCRAGVDSVKKFASNSSVIEENN
jgi:uncharacterized protein YegP (UPF0339 family)